MLACALNTHGSRTDFSSEVSVSTVKITDLSDYVETASIGDALIDELNLGRGWVGELKGNYIDAKQLSVTDSNGKRTLDIDSFGNVHLDVSTLKINSGDVAKTLASKANAADVYKKSETYTKTETDSVINVTKNSITNSVKENYYTKEETEKKIIEKGYATSSELQQTSNSIVAKFETSGGYNLIHNSAAKFGTNSWRHTSTEFYVTDSRLSDNKLNKTFCLNNGKNSNESFAYSSRFPLGVNNTYTLSGWFYNYTTCPSIDVFVLASKTLDETDASTNYDQATRVITTLNTNGVWVYKTVTFTLPDNCKSAFLRIDHNGYNPNGTGSNSLYFTGLMLTEGSLDVSWSPHPSESKSGIITMDQNGIEVDSSNVNTKTKMASDGFKIIRKSDNKELFAASGGDLTLEGVFKTGTSGQRIEASGANYKVFDGGTQKAFLGLATNDSWTNIPKLYMGPKGVGDSFEFTNYDYFSINSYEGEGQNPAKTEEPYTDIAHFSSAKKDYSNIKMFSDGDIRLAPIKDLEISSNYANGNYQNTVEKTIAKFSTSYSSYYNGHMQIQGVSNRNSGQGLVLEDWRDGKWSAVQVLVNTDSGDRAFRPLSDISGTVYLGTSNAKWKAIFSSNGSIQTSDQRYKMKLGQLDGEDCYEMVKNTNIYKYCMLSKSKEELTTNELKKLAKKSANEEVSIQTGIMAQDVLNYKCAKYILTHDKWVDETDKDEKEMYNINPYAFATSLMAALQYEIKLRERLEVKINELSEKISLIDGKKNT